MLFVGDDVLEGPFDALLEGVFADGAAGFGADAAGEVEAGVGVDEELHGLAETAADERSEGVDLGVGLEDVEVPGHGQMTVDVQPAAVFDHAEVVEVDPVVPAMGVQIRHHVLQQLHIRLVHDPCNGTAEDFIARLRRLPNAGLRYFLCFFPLLN